MKSHFDIDRAFRVLAQQPPSVSLEDVRRMVYSGRRSRRSWVSVWLSRVGWR